MWLVCITELRSVVSPVSKLAEALQPRAAEGSDSSEMSQEGVL